MYSCDGKSDFFLAPITSVSHDPSEIILICWFGAQDTFIVNIIYYYYIYYYYYITLLLHHIYIY